MLIAVTGASGHIGSNLIPALLRRGERVRAVLPAPQREGLPPGVEVRVADVRHAETLRPALEGAEVVIHLAALISIDADREGRVWATNVEGARNTAQAALAAGVRRFVHVSSIHAFDLAPFQGALTEEHRRPEPARPAYDRSKAAGEAAVREVMAQGLDVTICNPTAVIGPGDRAPSRMGRYFLDLASGVLPVVPGGGFDFVDVRDVVDSLIAAMEQGRRGENYLLGGRWSSSADMAKLATAFTGRRPPQQVPDAAFRALTRVLTAAARLTGGEALLTPEAMETLQSHRDISCAKAARELGHRPRPTEESVRDVYEDFVRTGRLERTRTGLRPTGSLL